MAYYIFVGVLLLIGMSGVVMCFLDTPKCPKCNHWNYIEVSRRSGAGDGDYITQKCQKCGEQFETFIDYLDYH